MLTQLLNAGLLQQLNGIAIGLNADCNDPKAAATTEYRQTLEDVLRERLLPLKSLSSLACRSAMLPTMRHSLSGRWPYSTENGAI